MTPGLAFVLVGWLVGFWLLWRVPLLRRAEPERPPGGVTVIVPARNEAATIGDLLDSLECQTLAPDQVLVVDDGSTDGTAEVAAAYAGVTVVAGGELPPGWTGKAWACHQGARLATGDVLVFCDADVTLGPDALAAAVATRTRLGGLVSVQPYHRMARAYEQFSAAFNVIGMMGVGCASPGRHARSAGAFGPCLVTRAEDYEAVGGHAAVRGEIVDDLALAKAYRAARRPVHTFGGGDLVSFRMYPHGLGQLIEGWSKNFATGAGSIPLARLVLVVVWVTAALTGVQWVLEAVFGGGSAVGPAVATAVYLAFAVQFGVMLRQLGDFTWLTAALYVVALGAFLAVFVRSLYLTVLRRRVAWRGRSVPLSHARRWSTTPSRRAPEVE